MNLYRQTNRAVRRAHKSMARDVDVYNYEYDPTGDDNPYADGDWVETSSTPNTVPATIRSNTQSEDESGPDGADIAGDMTIYVDPNDAEIEIGEGDETRATEFIDSATERRYKALDYHYQGSLFEVHCEVL
ncbi:hypothetical protein [Natrialba asiatica]|uniref:Uncharacterized protein n=1 Tax=Natrialba asiatica (strain ATCC 700177 / DSM 12278 / JCM 9576 / FERM P-10747 / NBRC 102637 / 172P1) TaxID=29540 RepID=M0APW5_NATA1|nr:hypothetical protein [Natrialba asiatica]ELZ00766.1 hypothetical protein C481_11045 [Natrialba asiatica DSM 12278]